MSSLLFNLYMAVKERLKNRRIGVRVGEIRLRNLAYADDLVLLAMNKEAMQDMMLSFKEFLKDRNLELNREKSKMLIFNKRSRDMKEKLI